MREITTKQLKEILAKHKMWVASKCELGEKADLSRANLSRADLSDTDLIGANLSGAFLSGADLSDTGLMGANLSGNNLSGANLSGANLTAADLSAANLSGATFFNTSLTLTDLRGANIKGVDLSNSYAYKTKLREEDLIGVKYRPEQLSDMIIERPEKEPIIAPEQKGTIMIRFAKENPPLLHLIYLSAFIEYQYDIFYIFLFSQYDSIDKLKDILTGSPFHWLKDKDEAVKITRMSTQSPPVIEFLGSLPVWLPIYSMWITLPKEIKSDLYNRITQAIWKTKKDKLEEELLTADVLNKYADALKKCREVGVSPADILPPGTKNETLPQAFQAEGPDKLARTIEEQNEDITKRQPRIDYLKTVLLLRQEGMLTNKLDDKALANLLEIIMEKAIQNHQSMCKETGDFEVDIKEVEKEEDKKKE